MKKTGIGIALLLVSGIASANSPKWDTAYVSYLNSNVDVGAADETFNGFGIGGSLSLSSDWLLIADLKSVSKDFGNASIDLRTTSVGGGYRFSMSNTTDLYGTATLETLAADVGNDDSSDTGFGLGVGIRSMLTPTIELDAKVDYLQIDSETVTRARAGADYFINENMSLGLSYELYSPSDVELDINTLSARFKYTF